MRAPKNFENHFEKKKKNPRVSQGVAGVVVAAVTEVAEVVAVVVAASVEAAG